MSKSWNTILDKVSDFDQRQGFTSFVNPFSMLVLKKESEIAREIDHWHVDGILLVKLINRLFGEKINRFSFDDTSIAPLVFEFAQKNEFKIACVGSDKISIDKAVAEIEKSYQVKITYYREGYFKTESEIQQSVEEIIKSNCKIVICGMGTPKQELFLLKLKTAGWVGYGYTCGGYFHQVANGINYYPDFFNKFNLRWVYRMYDEPKLAKRYLIKYPLFLLKFGVFRLTFFRKK